jgi:hypothetical protein
MGGICEVEMGSVATIYISSFIQIDSSIQKLIAGRGGGTDSMMISRPYFYFFQNKKRRLKKYFKRKH